MSQWCSAHCNVSSTGGCRLTEHQLRVRLQDPSADGAAFLSDVYNMLQALSARAGGAIGPFRPCASGEDAAHDVCAKVLVPLPPALSREIGRHRAQRVSHESTTGRVGTSLVSVELLPASASIPASVQMVRTYNYPLRRCTHHESGKTLPLETVLSGAVGE
jgi:protein subunit release factor A